jgi:hypothetical protein
VTADTVSVSVTVELDGSFAVLVVDGLDAASVDAFVDEVSALVQDRGEVRHVAVKVVGEPPPLLRYVVSVLDRQARTAGKTVDLIPLEA